MNNNQTINSLASGVSNRQAGSEAAGSPIRLWLVEDCDAVRELLVRLLNEEAGIQCLRSFASSEAMLSALAQESPPQLILSDLNLPGRSGIQAISAVRWLAPATPVVIMTSMPDPVQQAAALAAGAAGFVSKTCERAHFIKMIRQAGANPRPAVRRPEKRDQPYLPIRFPLVPPGKPSAVPWGWRALDCLRSLLGGLGERRPGLAAPGPSAGGGGESNGGQRKGKGLEETLAA